LLDTLSKPSITVEAQHRLVARYGLILADSIRMATAVDTGVSGSTLPQSLPLSFSAPLIIVVDIAAFSFLGDLKLLSARRPAITR
jgi:hypothetical protein